MPYLPPDTVDPGEYACALVFFPNAQAYSAALLGQIAELADVWNWETDRETQAEIRQLWLAAEQQTLECWRMGCLDDIITLLEEIRDHEWCCDGLGDAGAGDEIQGIDDTTLPPDVDRDGESFPPGWTGDPTGYDAYLCGQAENLAATTDEAVDSVYNAILAASNILVFATLVVLAFGNLIGMGIAAILAGGYTLVTISEVIGYYSAFTELRELLSGGDPQGLRGQTKSELAAITDNIEQAVFCANDAGEAYGTIANLIDANVTNASYAALLKLLYAISLRPIFWGFGGAPDSTDCECTGNPLGSWDWGDNQNGADGWNIWSGAGTSGDYLGRVTLGNMAWLNFNLDPGSSTISMTIFASRSGSAGSMDCKITVYDGEGTAGTAVTSQTIAVTGTDAALSEHTYELDVSGRAGDEITINIRKDAGSTGYALKIDRGSAFEL